MSNFKFAPPGTLGGCPLIPYGFSITIYLYSLIYIVKTVDSNSGMTLPEPMTNLKLLFSFRRVDWSDWTKKHLKEQEISVPDSAI